MHPYVRNGRVRAQCDQTLLMRSTVRNELLGQRLTFGVGASASKATFEALRLVLKLLLELDPISIRFFCGIAALAH